MTDELARRRAAHDQAEADKKARDSARVSPEAAAEIMQRAGFTAKRMAVINAHPSARTIEEALTADATPAVRLWQDRVAPDGPEMEQLRRARDANSLVQASRESQARRAAE